MVKYTAQNIFPGKMKKQKYKPICVCGKKIEVEVAGRYESLLIICPYCKKEVEFTKQEVEISI